MEKWQPLNMELRAWVIKRVLRLEQTSSSAIRAVLRMFNENSKTLGNQSSALSFKAKVDLLFDLDEISKLEHNHLVKLMEIRNQFAHNHRAVSFESLDDINSDINKYLLKFEPEQADKTQVKEVRLKFVFDEIFKATVGKLLVIEIEYTKGIEKEMRRHVNDHIIENFETIWQNALLKHKEEMKTTPMLFVPNAEEVELDNFYLHLRIAMSEFAQEELKSMEGEKMQAVLKQKETIQESIGKRREMKKGG